MVVQEMGDCVVVQALEGSESFAWLFRRYKIVRVLCGCSGGGSGGWLYRRWKVVGGLRGYSGGG